MTVREGIVMYIHLEECREHGPAFGATYQEPMYDRNDI